MGDGEEKTESATAKRKQDARKDGTVAKSTDLVNACCIIALLLVLPIATSSLGAGTVTSLKSNLGTIPMQIGANQILGFIMSSAHPMLPGLSMIVFTSMVVGLAVNFGQVGFVLSGKAITPNFNKINPLKGLSKFVSRNSLFETAKGLGKVALFSAIATGCIHSSWDQINTLNQVPVTHAMSVIGGILRSLGMRIGFSWAALAGLDYFFQRQQIDRSLKMTKYEVRKEMKESETSPEIRNARNIRRRRLMRQRLREAVRSADVIVTNPTHYAIALKYEMGKGYAPIVVAKGVDYLAAKIRSEAAYAEIPLVPNPPLARALYKQCEVGDYVPRELFQAVAEVLAYVYRTINKVPKPRS